ncbi:SDR family NAD(P)-dependent oxidoreductase [Gemmatimonas sp.]|uniref:SDR family NAD(P)-dependent oxidoreductase n=1 Tax=Gemmatimonas sp. TaxID=1962908 RepID=UPI0035685780
MPIDTDPSVAPDYVADLFDLSGRTAVVTGGGSGLGDAISRGLAQAGARVIVADVNLDGAEHVAAGIRDIGGSAEAVDADVTVRGTLEAVSATLDRVDILVNSAGTSARFPAEDFPEDVYDRIIGLNLKGSFLSCQVFGRRMLDQGAGSIINIASIGSSVAYPQTTAYLQSKGGVAQMTRSLALEWISRGVRVNAIAPSLFDTPLVRASDDVVSLTSEFIMARTPIGRRGLPTEVVGPAIFLASSASSMVTGHLLQVDGGYLIN